MSQTNVLLSSINYCKPYLAFNSLFQGSSLFTGLGGEPAVSIQSLVRATILEPGNVWSWNRAQVSFVLTQGTQDYKQAVPDFGFLERASLQDPNGVRWEIKDIYNTGSLVSASTPQGRPNAVSVELNDGSGNITFRFLGSPDQAYTVNLEYQKAPPPAGMGGVNPYTATSCGNASSGLTTYTGSYQTLALPALSYVLVGGLSNAGNNGTFKVSSVTPTSLVLFNANGVLETPSSPASVFPNAWGIPDELINIVNFLFLAEMMAISDDPRATIYRQRGMASLIARQDGLMATQKNPYTQQVKAHMADDERTQLSVQQAVQARIV